MRKWPLALGLALTAIGSVTGYFALQILVAFAAFFMYGSGNMGASKWMNVGALFVAAQLLLVSYLFYHRKWLTRVPTLLLALLIPVGLFIVLEYPRLLPDK